MCACMLSLGRRVCKLTICCKYESHAHTRPLQRPLITIQIAPTCICECVCTHARQVPCARAFTPTRIACHVAGCMYVSPRFTTPPKPPPPSPPTDAGERKQLNLAAAASVATTVIYFHFLCRFFPVPLRRLAARVRRRRRRRWRALVCAGM